MYITEICDIINYMKTLDRDPVGHREIQRKFSEIASEVRDDKTIVPVSDHGKVYGYFVPSSLMDSAVTKTEVNEVETDPEKLLLLSDEENERLALHWTQVADRIYTNEDFAFVDGIEEEWPLDS